MMFMMTMPPTRMPMQTTAGMTAKRTPVRLVQNATRASALSTVKSFGSVGTEPMRQAHRLLGPVHGGRDVGALRHLDRDRRGQSPPVELLEDRDGHQDEAIERLAKGLPFRGDHALDGHFVPSDPDLLPDRQLGALEELLRHVESGHRHPATRVDVRLGERFAVEQDVVLDDLELRSDPADLHRAERPVPIDHVGAGRRPSRLEGHGARVRERAAHCLRILAS